MQSACDARLQELLHGVHSRARIGIEASISYQVIGARPASHSSCLMTGASVLERSMSSRWEGRNADGGEAVDSGTSRLCI
jgi:hypothetical protein